MQKFYIHLNNEQQGPFDLEELKSKNITPETLIWHEGMDNWQKANSIEALKDILKTVPPSIGTYQKNIPPALQEKTIKQNTIAESKKINKTLIYGLSIIVFVGIVSYLIWNEQKKAEIQTQLQEQNALIQEQQRIENDRKQAEIEAAKEAQRQANKIAYDEAVTNLRLSKVHFEEVQKFQLLRTSEEKQQQVKEALENIKAWENEVDRLQKLVGE